MMTLSEALIPSVIVLGSTGTVVSSAAVLLWKKHPGQRLPRWFRVTGPMLTIASLIYAVICLISVAHLHKRGPLISHGTFLIGFILILTVTLVWCGFAMVLFDGRWPPSRTIASVMISATGITATYYVFLLLNALAVNFWLTAAAALLLLALISGLGGSGWVILVAPIVTVSVLVLGWYWGLLATDLHDYILEETPFTRGMYFYAGIIFVLPLTTIVSAVGLWLGSLWEQAHENREQSPF